MKLSKGFCSFVLVILLVCALPLWPAVQTLFVQWIPFPLMNVNQGTQAFLLDAATEKHCVIATMSKSCTLDKIGFWLSTVTTGDVLRGSFQNVDPATGDADGTPDETCTATIADTDDGKWIDNSTSPALGLCTSGGNGAGSGRSVSAGDRCAGCIEFNSWVAGSLFIQHLESQFQHWSNATAYPSHYTGSWTKATGLAPSFAFGCSDGTWQQIPGLHPFKNVMQGLSFNVDTGAQDEVGLRFRLPYVSTLGVAASYIDLDGDADICLYDGATNPCYSLDKDVRSGTGPSWAKSHYANVSIAANTTYTLSVKPTTTTNVTVHYHDAQSNAILGTLEGGIEMYWRQRVDAGSWTDTTTRRPLIVLGLSGHDDGTGGGGAIPVSSGVASLRFPKPKPGSLFPFGLQ